MSEEWREVKPGLWEALTGPFCLRVRCDNNGYDGSVDADGPMTEPHGDRRVRLVGSFNHTKTLRESQVLAESIAASAMEWVLRLADDWRTR